MRESGAVGTGADVRTHREHGPHQHGACLEPAILGGADGPSTEVGHGPRNGQQVALTFHGQGDPAVATSVLAALAAGHAKVTVMAVGSWLEAYPSMAASITGGGHESWATTPGRIRTWRRCPSRASERTSDAAGTP